MPGAYDPQPDYFFHWYRDSAIIADALRLLAEDGESGIDTRGALTDFVDFSLNLRALDGRSLAGASWRHAVAADQRRHLRSLEELARIHGDAVALETRVNPDGTLDVLDWPRPQHDGPALRALTLLRWMRSPRFDASLAARAGALVRADLNIVRALVREPCFDIWEEQFARHYYTQRLGAAALAAGADWLDASAVDAIEAAACRRESRATLAALDAYWLDGEHHYRSRIPASGERTPKDLDMSVVLAANHAADGRSEREAHGVHDPKMHATLERLEQLFEASYAINRGRPAGRAPAMGRYAGDAYYSGGAYYFSTLGAAEFYYRASAGGGDPLRRIERGDAFLRTVRAFTPEDGELSEQFDQNTGEPRSARHLAWSYAAFISCVAARRAATQEMNAA